MVDAASAQRRLTKALVLATSLGDSATVGMSESVLGWTSFLLDDPIAGIPHLERALATLREVSDERSLARIVNLLALARLTQRARREEAYADLELQDFDQARRRSALPARRRPRTARSSPTGSCR